MKYIIFIFFSFFSIFTYSIENNGGIVNFGGYVFESPCEYNRDYNTLILTCYEKGNDKNYYFQLSSLNENRKNINSIKISEINLSKVLQGSAITTISYR